MIPSNFIKPRLNSKTHWAHNVFLRRLINIIDVADDSTSQERRVPNWNWQMSN